MKKIISYMLAFLCALSFGTLISKKVTVDATVGSPDITDYYIVAENNQTVEFASSELKDYIHKITGYIAPVYTIGDNIENDGTPIYMGKISTLNDSLNLRLTSDDLKWDGYKLVPVNGGMAIASNEYRGVIYGVYEALERVGCEWYGSYEGGEYVPQSKEINLIIDQAVTINPDSWHRCYHNEGWYENGISQANDERLYSYMLKMRCNYYGRGYSQTIWDIIDKYDLVKDDGGHGVADKYLTDAVFKTHPEYFVEKNGKRVRIDAQTNWCCNPANGALDFLAEKIGDTLRADRKIKVFTIFGVDTAATGGDRGGWCNCEWCSQHSTADLSLMSILHIANKLADEFPDVHFGNIYYHDTLDTSKLTYKKEDIPDNVFAMWAAREKCPKHSILDANCAKNVWHKEQYDNLYNIFGDDKIYGFLYYGDGVLYNKGVFYNAEQIIEEVRYFVSHGMNSFLELSTNEIGGFMYGFNESVVFRILFDNDYDAESYLKRYKQWFFGTDLATANKITDMLYTMTGEINKYCGYTIDCDTRYIQITDTSSMEFGFKHAEDIRATLPMYAELDQIFNEILQNTNDIGVKERIGKLRCHMQMTKVVAEYTAWAIEGLSHKYNGDRDKLSKCMDEAILLLRLVEPLYNSWPTNVKDGNTYWYVTALGSAQEDLFNWLKW